MGVERWHIVGALLLLSACAARRDTDATDSGTDSGTDMGTDAGSAPRTAVVPARPAAATRNLDDPSWFRCASDADCAIISVGTSCAWLAVRAEQAVEYANLDAERIAALGVGPGCQRIPPKPSAVCRSSRCEALEAHD